MSIQLSNSGANIKVVKDGNANYIMKSTVKSISIISGNTLKIQTDGCCSEYFPYSKVSAPTTANINDLRDLVIGWLEPVSDVPVVNGEFAIYAINPDGTTNIPHNHLFFGVFSKKSGRFSSFVPEDASILEKIIVKASTGLVLDKFNTTPQAELGDTNFENMLDTGGNNLLTAAFDLAVATGATVIRFSFEKLEEDPGVSAFYQVSVTIGGVFDILKTFTLNPTTPPYNYSTSVDLSEYGLNNSYYINFQFTEVFINSGYCEYIIDLGINMFNSSFNTIFTTEFYKAVKLTDYHIQGMRSFGFIPLLTNPETSINDLFSVVWQLPEG